MRIKEILLSIADSFAALILPLVIIGAIVLGIATVTEVAAVSAVYALVVSTLLYRSLGKKKIVQALRDTAYATTVIMMIVSTSTIFTWCLIQEGVPRLISSGLLSLGLPGWALLGAMVLTMLIAGTFMDLVPNMFIFVPIFFPLAAQIGVDPVHFGVLMVCTLAMGLFTPPVGATLFISCHLAQISIEDTYKDLLPFFLGGAAVVFLTAYVPAFTLWLPSVLLR
jgi:tripartite ATP-independent transporter DctM subunit